MTFGKIGIVNENLVKSSASEAARHKMQIQIGRIALNSSKHGLRIDKEKPTDGEIALYY